MNTIVITLSDGSRVCTNSITIKDGSVKTDEAIIDTCNIKRTEIMWLSEDDMFYQQIIKI